MQSELEVEKEMGKNFEEPTEDLISLDFFFQGNTMTGSKSQMH